VHLIGLNRSAGGVTHGRDYAADARGEKPKSEGLPRDDGIANSRKKAINEVLPAGSPLHIRKQRHKPQKHSRRILALPPLQYPPVLFFRVTAAHSALDAVAADV
jgi:hypothetical protein